MINIGIYYSSSSSLSNNKSTSDFVEEEGHRSFPEMLASEAATSPPQSMYLENTSRKSKPLRHCFFDIRRTLVLYGTHKSCAIGRDNLH